MGKLFNILEVSVAIIVLTVILAGVYYSITMTKDFNDKTFDEKMLAVFITTATILASIFYVYNFVIVNLLMPIKPAIIQPMTIKQ
jgi:heme/copper-type cytochrome/quinol oxidase subunit 2